MAIIPDWLQQKLKECPTTGGGVNLWIFAMAGKLRAFVSHAEAKAALRDATANCGRQVRDVEIDRALSRAQPMKLSTEGYEQFPGRDQRLCDHVDDLSLIEAADYWEESPVFLGRPEPQAESIIRALFRPNETCCLVRRSLHEAALHPVDQLPCDVHQHSFIVPNPMKPEGGTTDDGKPSWRSKNGVTHRRYVVADFDQDDPKLHLRRIDFLRKMAPLVMVVWSGGKGWHGWFYVEHKPASAVRQFIELVCKLGGDKAAWQPHQVFRLPDGWRYANPDKPGSRSGRQFCIYLNPVLA